MVSISMCRQYAVACVAAQMCDLGGGDVGLEAGMGLQAGAVMQIALCTCGCECTGVWRSRFVCTHARE